MKMPKYDSIFASKIGSSHRDRGEEKQDSVAILNDKSGNITFCLSDGAGSSKYSQLSSKISADFIASALLDLPKEIDARGVGAWINDYIVQCVLDLRKYLFKEFDTYDLRDYHCTLVAGILFQGNCLVAHIGDGAIIAGTCDVTKDAICINEKLVVSEPENGEYKNETFFLTEPHWLSHLRIKFIPNVDWLIAGTDGGIDLLSERDKLNDNYVFELMSTLLFLSKKRKQEALQLHLGSAEADEITNDDKSLVIINSRELSKSKNVIWDADGPSFEDFYPKLQGSLRSTEIQTPSPVNPAESIDQDGVSSASDLKRTLVQVAEFITQRPVITSLSSVFFFLIAYALIVWQISPPNSEIGQPEITTSDNGPDSLQIDKIITSDEVDSRNIKVPHVSEYQHDNSTVINGDESELNATQVPPTIKDEVDTKNPTKVENDPLSTDEEAEFNDPDTKQHQVNVNKDELGMSTNEGLGSSVDTVEQTLEEQTKNNTLEKEKITITNSETSSSVAPPSELENASSSNLD